MKNVKLYLICFTILIMFSGIFCTREEESYSIDLSVPVQVEDVKRGTIESFVTSTGTLDPLKEIIQKNELKGVLSILENPQSGKLYTEWDRIQKGEMMKGEETFKVQRDILDVFIYDATARIRKLALDIIYSFASGDTRDLLLKGVDHYTCVEGINIRDARRRIADMLISENRYCF